MATAPATQSLTVRQGATFQHDFTVYSDAAETTPQDLTAFSARAQVRDGDSPEGELIFSFTATVLSPASSGVVRISLLPETTAALSDVPRRLFYDVEIVSGVSVVYRIAQGIVTFDPEVTV